MREAGERGFSRGKSFSSEISHRRRQLNYPIFAVTLSWARIMMKTLSGHGRHRQSQPFTFISYDMRYISGSDI